MTQLQIKLRTENMSIAEVTAVSDLHVTLAVDPKNKWDAEGLLKLSAMLKGVAATLVATAAAFLFVTAADAVGWTDWVPGPSVVNAQEYHAP